MGIWCRDVDGNGIKFHWHHNDDDGNSELVCVSQKKKRKKRRNEIPVEVNSVSERRMYIRNFGHMLFYENVYSPHTYTHLLRLMWDCVSNEHPASLPTFNDSLLIYFSFLSSICIRKPYVETIRDAVTDDYIHTFIVCRSTCECRDNSYFSKKLHFAISGLIDFRHNAFEKKTNISTNYFIRKFSTCSTQFDVEKTWIIIGQLKGFEDDNDKYILSHWINMEKKNPNKLKTILRDSIHEFDSMRSLDVVYGETVFWFGLCCVSVVCSTVSACVATVAT